ncbi:MAG: hypothetical protein CR966_00240 [Pseudomonadales bacterium]|nr:MAG: hypothetical protein CR966_00240 [Pseudomonadales bacterium]
MKNILFLLSLLIIPPFTVIQTTHANVTNNVGNVVINGGMNGNMNAMIDLNGNIKDGRGKLSLIHKANKFNDLQKLGLSDILLKRGDIPKINKQFMLTSYQNTVNKNNQLSTFMNSSLSVNSQQTLAHITTNNLNNNASNNVNNNGKQPLLATDVRNSKLASSSISANSNNLQRSILLEQPSDNSPDNVTDTDSFVPVDFANINIKQYELATMQVLSEVCPKYLDSSQHATFNKAFNAQLRKLLPQVKNPKAAMKYLSNQPNYRKLLESVRSWTLSYSAEENKQLCQDVVIYKY